MWAYELIYESSLLSIAPVHIKLVKRCPLHKKLLATVQISYFLTLSTLDLNTSYSYCIDAIICDVIWKIAYVSGADLGFQEGGAQSYARAQNFGHASQSRPTTPPNCRGRLVFAAFCCKMLYFDEMLKF